MGMYEIDVLIESKKSFINILLQIKWYTQCGWWVVFRAIFRVQCDRKLSMVSSYEMPLSLSLSFRGVSLFVLVWDVVAASTSFIHHAFERRNSIETDSITNRGVCVVVAVVFVACARVFAGAGAQSEYRNKCNTRNHLRARRIHCGQRRVINHTYEFEGHLNTSRIWRWGDGKCVCANAWLCLVLVLFIRLPQNRPSIRLLIDCIANRKTRSSPKIKSYENTQKCHFPLFRSPIHFLTALLRREYIQCVHFDYLRYGRLLCAQR